MVKIDPLCFFVWAVQILVLPLPWLLAVVVAVIVHELFHLGAMFLFHCRVFSLRVGICGLAIVTQFSTYYEELICAVSGPVGSFLLASFCGHLPLVRVVGLLQGIYNLLPIYPMDGGRILRCFAVHFFADKADWIVKITEYLVYAILFGLVFRFLFFYKAGIFCWLLSLLLFWRVLHRIFSCKRGAIGVQ